MTGNCIAACSGVWLTGQESGLFGVTGGIAKTGVVLGISGGREHGDAVWFKFGVSTYGSIKTPPYLASPVPCLALEVVSVRGYCGCVVVVASGLLSNLAETSLAGAAAAVVDWYGDFKLTSTRGPRGTCRCVGYGVCGIRMLGLVCC